jgi:hypothetical protein
MKAITDFLVGKKTYIVLAVALIFNLGVALGFWPVDNQTWGVVDSILIFLGLGTVRAGMKTTASSLDISGTVGFLSGYKTYIVVVAGIAYNLLILFGVITPEWPGLAVIDELFLALGLGTFRVALAGYTKGPAQ